MNCVVASLAVGLISACVVSLPALPVFTPDSAGTAQAQKAKAKAKAKQRPSRPRPRRRRHQGSAAAHAVHRGGSGRRGRSRLPDARVWGDTAAEFRKVLPTVAADRGSQCPAAAPTARSRPACSTGWTQSGKRPDFTVVTGVSIGALLAPYAFLGAQYDEELRNSITTITGADIFEDRPTPRELPRHLAAAALIEKRVTPELVAGVAAEHSKGRRLLVVTTNVDAGRRVIWDMGAIAEKGDETALKLFRDVLLASSAIPGFFQPVMIDVEANGKKFQEMHIDGSVTSPFFVAPEALLEAGSKACRCPATELYIVLNAGCRRNFYLPERNTVSILSRLIGVVLKVGLRAEADAVRRQRAAARRADPCRAGGRQLPASRAMDCSTKNT